ncbi:hypothetical protein [Actinobacillus equuli]|uniref:Lipoprotein n=1 Tax=Actinobacillus equuli TaxID=718 RepID=A0AAX3FPW1_ACTEU|nr:hypothetical protein [Actinobacillus equuli]AIZ78556.1 hypothetical protein ACEE_01925 [Actinobacillus equuli subsp. equuli]WGE44821.1 hypothetical protein NYR65_01920 [Actinobacillus equuli subsp. equuli]VEE92577.1 Uncharacterised protein [Actinobacillus equuli]
MKLLVTLCSMFFLVSCSFGGFKPPKLYYIWYSKNKKFESLIDLVDAKEKDMRTCGMDPVLGESGSAKTNLCLERKGWYLKGGPVCENELMWNQPLCIQWRAEHSKPNAKPWGK